MRTGSITIIALAVTMATAVHADFSFAVTGFGTTEGSPYTTSDGSGCYVHSSQDFGDGAPSLFRPLHTTFPTTPDLEWTSSMSHDGLGPTRRSGTPNNSADSFYLSRGVYASGFTSRNANLLSIIDTGIPGGVFEVDDTASRLAVVEAGTVTGFSVITGPAVPSGRSPDPMYASGITTPGGLPVFYQPQGVFLARFTVHRGVTISGLAACYGAFAGSFQGGVSLVLDGPAVPFPSGGTPLTNGLRLASYLVAQPTINDAQFGTDTPFGEADVYDIWVSEAYIPIPTPGVLAPIGMVVFAGFRRCRA